MHKITPYILSGGSGKRLWPLSRSLNPKQFVQLNGKKSYFQLALSRFNSNLYKNPNIICNENHRFMVKDQAQQINKKLEKIFLEPVGKNTLPAAIVSALASDKDDIILLVPSDHIIGNKTNFNQCVKKSIADAINGKIVLFGIKPDRPETGYGYICLKNNKIKDSLEIEKFIEKPNISNAKKIYKKSNVYWNSGIFLFKASTLLSEAKKYCPENYAFTKKSLEGNVYLDKCHFLNEKYFEKNKSISIDYAIIQKSKVLVMNHLKSEWSDMGSWNSFWNHSKKDKNKNYIVGKNYNKNCKGSLIISDKQLTVTSGLTDFIVVSQSDSLLIMPKDQSNKLSEIVEKLDKKNFKEIKYSKKCYRPWGSYEILQTCDFHQVKELTLNPHSSISLQKHKKRSEHWVVVEGIATVIKNKDEIILKKNNSIDINKGDIHRLTNNTSKILKVIEIQTGSYLGEDDIIRFEDRYKRK